MRQKQISISQLLSILELPIETWKLNNQVSPKEAVILLNEFKNLAKKQHHKLVKKYHPDLPQNGEKEEARMKQINSIMDHVKTLKIRASKRPPQVIRFRTFFSHFNPSATTANSSTLFRGF